MITLVEMEEEFHKMQRSFTIKTLSKVGRAGIFFNLIKSIYKNPTTNIPNGERLDTLPLRSGTRQGRIIMPF